MKLEQWLSKMESLHPQGIDLGLTRVQTVGHRANLLTFSCPVIMVAGTNGKGSTVAALAQLLSTAGLQVATYTSPHLLRFNERIQINGVSAHEEALCSAFEKVDKWRETTPLTFFEFTTLAAFALFKEVESSLSAILLEVGLGGRLDAVNAVDPTLCIITSIGFDHQAWLGNTLEAISKEKAGILRPQVPVVLGKSAQCDVIMKEVERLGNPCWREGVDFDYSAPLHQAWQFTTENVQVPLTHLPHNSVSLAMAAYTILGSSQCTLIPLQKAINGLAKVTMVGRFQSIKQQGITVLFDVAHNAPASDWLAKKLHPYKEKGRIIAVWSSLSDKDLAGIIAPMKNIIDSWCIGEIQDKRSTPLQELSRHLTAQGISAVHAFHSITSAFNKATALASPEDTIIVFGSFMTVAAILPHFYDKNTLCENNSLMEMYG